VDVEGSLYRRTSKCEPHFKPSFFRAASRAIDSRMRFSRVSGSFSRINPNYESTAVSGCQLPKELPRFGICLQLATKILCLSKISKCLSAWELVFPT